MAWAYECVECGIRLCHVPDSMLCAVCERNKTKIIKGLTMNKWWVKIIVIGLIVLTLLVGYASAKYGTPLFGSSL